METNLLENIDPNVKSDIIMSKEEFLARVNSCQYTFEKNISNQIWKVIRENKNKYGKYIKLISVQYYDVEKACAFIKNELFNTDMLFIINVINMAIYGLKSKIYIKLYNPNTYPSRLALKFNKKLNNALKKNKKYIYMKNMIATKNKLKAECYARLYNKILGNKGYKFIYEMYAAGFKYYVYTKLPTTL